MSEVFQQTLAGKRRKAADKRAVETGGGKEGVSWKNVENGGKRTIFTWDVGIFPPRKKQSKEVSRARKASPPKRMGIGKNKKTPSEKFENFGTGQN